ncbi:MAG: peptide ABC transporter substrate-binding protein [Caldilinea sp. CFX5]|nr:peptide ABC transporter substrate-binding protein [Caldilinea sp. CFX5]
MPNPKYLLALLILALFLALCTAPQRNIAGPEVLATAGGGQVVLLIPEEPITLNQYLAAAPIVRQVADATTAGLTTVDASGNFQPVLAAELPTLANGGVSPDFRTVTWRLRPGLRWSDGAPLTADDIKFTWEAVAHPESGTVFSFDFDLIDHIETPDALTAVVHYKATNLAYLQQFMVGLLPRHATGAPAEMSNWAWNRQPVSAGPFVVREWTPGERIVMARNPHYYLTGQPYLDRLIFAITPATDAQLAAMAQEQAHLHLWPGESKAVYDQQMAGQATLAEIPGQWNMALYLNLSKPFDDEPGSTPPHPILGDLRVRQALAHAIDYERIVREINPGVAPATTPFAYGWYQCALDQPYPYDPDKARALLAAAGWLRGDDGIRVAYGARYTEEGSRLTLHLNGYTNFEPLVRLEEALVEMFKAVGVEVIVQNDDIGLIFGSYQEGSPRKLGNFDLLLYDASLPIEPQTAVVNAFHSTEIPSPENPAGANYSRWVNAAADAAIAKAGATVDVAERKAAYCDLAHLIAADVPRIHLYRFTEGYGVSNRLRGYQVNMWGSLTWDAQQWKLRQ